jgi:glutamine amidotransferase
MATKPAQWFSSGTTFSEYAKGGHYKMNKADKRENIIMVSIFRQVAAYLGSLYQVASEPLTFEQADWMEIRTNYMAVITPKMNLLQIPITDKYFVPSMSPAYRQRGTEYAEAKGLLSPTERRPRANSSAPLSLSVSKTAEIVGGALPVPPESAIAMVH